MSRARFMHKSLDDVRCELSWMRNELAARLERIRRDAAHGAQPLSADAPDRAQEQENDEVLCRLDESTTALLRQYEHALERLDAGAYGRCEGCGGAIEPERLDAMPQATTCRACARRQPAQAA